MYYCDANNGIVILCNIIVIVCISYINNLIKFVIYNKDKSCSCNWCFVSFLCVLLWKMWNEYICIYINNNIVVSKMADNFFTEIITCSPDTIFRCDACGRVYKHKSSWYQHRRYECGKNPQFFCHLCPYKAKQKQNLKTHMLFKHQLR